MEAAAITTALKGSRRLILVLAAVVLVLVALGLLHRMIDIPELHRRAEGVNGVLVFALITVLPLAGFPVSVVHAVAGIRFGFGLGMMLVAVSIVLQLLASYALVKALPGFFNRRLASLRGRLPKATHHSLTLFTLLVPGVPYFAKNYVLPLAGVPLGIFLLWSVPLHIARSVIGVVFGDLSDNLTPGRIAGFVAYAAAITLACLWSFRRLQQRMQDPPPGAGGRTRPA